MRSGYCPQGIFTLRDTKSRNLTNQPYEVVCKEGQVSNLVQLVLQSNLETKDQVLLDS